MDEIEMSPFVARALGKHGAFLHRTNAGLVKVARERISERQLGEASFTVARDSRSKPARAETGTGSVHESDGARSAIARNPLKLRAV